MAEMPILPEGCSVVGYCDAQCLQLYTIKQAAKKLRINYRSLLEVVNGEKLPHYQIGRSRRLVSLEEVIMYMKRFPRRIENEGKF